MAAGGCGEDGWPAGGGAGPRGGAERFALAAGFGVRREPPSESGQLSLSAAAVHPSPLDLGQAGASASFGLLVLEVTPVPAAPRVTVWRLPGDSQPLRRARGGPTGSTALLVVGASHSGHWSEPAAAAAKAWGVEAGVGPLAGARSWCVGSEGDMTAEPPAPSQLWVLSPDTVVTSRLEALGGPALSRGSLPSWRLDGGGSCQALHPDWLPDQPHSFPQGGCESQSHCCSCRSQEMPGQS